VWKRFPELNPLLGAPFQSRACGVLSDNEESFPLVAGTDIGRSESTPFRIEPCFGKVTENGVKPKSNVPWHVFQHDDCRS
jgi:hypothetical protein